MQLKEIKFEEFEKYLIDNNVFGFTAKLRKNTIIYSFVRFFNKNELKLKVKVDRTTKYIESVLINKKIYTALDDVKKYVERRKINI